MPAPPGWGWRLAIAADNGSGCEAVDDDVTGDGDRQSMQARQRGAEVSETDAFNLH